MPSDSGPQTLSIAMRLPCGLKNCGRTDNSTQPSPGDTNGKGVLKINLQILPALVLFPPFQWPEAQAGSAEDFSSP